MCLHAVDRLDELIAEAQESSEEESSDESDVSTMSCRCDDCQNQDQTDPPETEPRRCVGNYIDENGNRQPVFEDTG